uniref:Nucleolar protein 14 n=1 Tax=Anopheles dirus TaxID=7168 RepID=A0A182N8G5_9DIPT
PRAVSTGLEHNPGSASVYVNKRGFPWTEFAKMCAKQSGSRSDAVLRRKKKAAAAGARANPFETVVMKSKHAVLNRGIQSKRPGQLQRISHEKRTETLGKEFELLHKTNRFLDERGKNKYARAAPSKKAQAKEMYNLNLTHAGRTMHEIENFDDVPDGADEDEDEDGVLQESFTKATHFGGGSDDEQAPGRDRRSVIEQMIAESKRHKADRQRESDALYEMRQKLDDELRQLMPQFTEHIVTSKTRGEPDDYDRTLREMMFEPRGVPTEKLKSIDLAAAEQKRRETLEREKQERMEGELGRQQAAATAKANRPISADALSDEYLVQEVVDEDEAGEYAANGEEEDEQDDEEGEEESDEESGSSDADSLSDLKAATQQREESEDESEPEPEPTPAPEAAPKPQSKRPPQQELHTVPTFKPRIVDVPQEYEQYAALLEGKDVDGRVEIVASMVHTLRVKTFLHKSRWSVLFAYTLNQLCDRFANATTDSIAGEFRALHLLAPLLHDMLQADPATLGQVFLSVLEEKYADRGQHPTRYPPLATIALLKLVPLLFSASDRRHSVVTPALVFIGEVLTRCQVRNRRDLARGLLLVTTVLECVEQSKRFLPATVAFLTGVLTNAIKPTTAPTIATIGQPFKIASGLLLTQADAVVSIPAGDELLTAQDLLSTEITASFKVRAVTCTVSLATALCTQLSATVTAIPTIAQHFLRLLKDLPEAHYPAAVLQHATTTLTALARRPLPYMVQAARKPKPLQLLEPKIAPVYDDIRRRPKAAIPLREQRRKLQQKVKKVTRGAKREIRLDNEFIANLQHKRRMQSDRERQQKVRQIFSHASEQQAEWKSLDRRAKYRK